MKTRLRKISFPLIFSTRIQTLTTKSIITGTTLPDNSQIGVFSWGHHKNDGSVNTTLRKDLANNLYTKEAGDTELAASTDAHYPINPDTLLNFYAYYPYIQSAAHTPGSIPFDLSKQEDIMWSTPVLNRSKATNEEAVNLAFNHLLSAVTIKFQKDDDIKEEMILESISLANYSPTLQLDIQTGKLTQAVSTATYTFIKGLNTPVIPAQQTIVTDYLLFPVPKPVFIVRMSGKEHTIESLKAFESGKKQTYESLYRRKTSISPAASIPGQMEVQAMRRFIFSNKNLLLANTDHTFLFSGTSSGIFRSHRTTNPEHTLN